MKFLGHKFRGQFSNVIFAIAIPLYFIFKELRFYLIPFLYCVGIIGCIEILFYDNRIYNSSSTILLLLALFFHIAILFLPLWQKEDLKLDNYGIKEYLISIGFEVFCVLFICLWYLKFINDRYKWPYVMNQERMIMLFIVIYSTCLVVLKLKS